MQAMAPLQRNLSLSTQGEQLTEVWGGSLKKRRGIGYTEFPPQQVMKKQKSSPAKGKPKAPPSDGSKITKTNIYHTLSDRSRRLFLLQQLADNHIFLERLKKDVVRMKRERKEFMMKALENMRKIGATVTVDNISEANTMKSVGEFMLDNKQRDFEYKRILHLRTALSYDTIEFEENTRDIARMMKTEVCFLYHAHEGKEMGERDIARAMLMGLGPVRSYKMKGLIATTDYLERSTRDHREATDQNYLFLDPKKKLCMSDRMVGAIQEIRSDLIHRYTFLVSGLELLEGIIIEYLSSVSDNPECLESMLHEWKGCYVSDKEYDFLNQMKERCNKKIVNLINGERSLHKTIMPDHPLFGY